ncbi:MAG TPA: choice-of-anchor K domain-containing protein, partial [Stellaceae bacterium]|nr:choice-of-anchor K domain-containing protein [Stellaceae bacterium]
MRVYYGLLAAVVAAPLALASHDASATAYTFSSSGTFSNLNGAYSINSDNSAIEWGGSFDRHGNYNGDGSTLTANPLSGQTGNTPATADQIGSLTWYNASTSSDNTSSTVTANYNLSIVFSQPGAGGSVTDIIKLVVTNTPNCNPGLGCFFGIYANVADTLVPLDQST